jgi:hypothetical protein
MPSWRHSSGHRARHPREGAELLIRYAAKQILRLARDIDADLIVVGLATWARSRAPSSGVLHVRFSQGRPAGDDRSGHGVGSWSM